MCTCSKSLAKQKGAETKSNNRLAGKDATMTEAQADKCGEKHASLPTPHDRDVPIEGNLDSGEQLGQKRHAGPTGCTPDAKQSHQMSAVSLTLNYVAYFASGHVQNLFCTGNVCQVNSHAKKYVTPSQ